MIYSKCPYCGKYNDSKFRIDTNYGNSRSVICNKCNKKYLVEMSINVSVQSIESELISSLPQDKIETIKKVVSKYLGYQGMGGYENSRRITINTEMEAKINPNANCYIIELCGKATYYQNEYRCVTFEVYHDCVEQSVDSSSKWKQNWWWNGGPESNFTLEEKVDRYINYALVRWETI